MTDQEKRENNKALLREQYERLMEIAVAGRSEIEKFFTDDVVMELPFLNVKSEGLDNMIGAVQSVAQNFERYALRSMAFYDCIDPDTLIYEAEADAIFRHSGEPYPQRYINIVQFRDGRICRNVEYMNVALLAGFPRQPELARRLEQ
jgi:ketosteroid isomerase-like protein